MQTVWRLRSAYHCRPSGEWAFREHLGSRLVWEELLSSLPCLQIKDGKLSLGSYKLLLCRCSGFCWVFQIPACNKGKRLWRWRILKLRVGLVLLLIIPDNMILEKHLTLFKFSALGWSLFKSNWRYVGAMWFILHVLQLLPIYLHHKNFCCISKPKMTHQPKLKWKSGQFSHTYGYWKCLFADSLIGIHRPSQSCSLLGVN